MFVVSRSWRGGLGVVGGLSPKGQKLGGPEPPSPSTIHVDGSQCKACVAAVTGQQNRENITLYTEVVLFRVDWLLFWDTCLRMRVGGIQSVSFWRSRCTAAGVLCGGALAVGFVTPRPPPPP